VKRLLIIVIEVILLAACGMKVQIQGVDMDWIKHREWTKVASGAVVSVAIHELAHYAVAEAKGLNPKFDGPTTFRYDHEDEWVERAGFLTQTGVGLVFNLIPATRDSDFTIGWNGIATAQLYSYDLRNGDEGDFDTTGQNEWILFLGTSTVNTLWTMNNQKWKSKTHKFEGGNNWQIQDIGKMNSTN